MAARPAVVVVVVPRAEALAAVRWVVALAAARREAVVAMVGLVRCPVSR